MSYTTSDLLSSIKTRGMIPTNNKTFQDTDLLDLATEELRLGLASRLQSTREEYYVTYKDFTPDGKEYFIPNRATGMKLRDVKLVDGSDNEWNARRIDPNDTEYYDSGSGSGYNQAFFVRGNKIIFVGEPTNTVRLYYYLRPSKLIKTTEASKITSINTDTNEVEVNSVPSGIDSSSEIDLIKADPGYDLLEMDVSISSLSGTTYTFSSLPDDLKVGDYIATAGESPVVQLPLELFPILAQRVVVKVLEALGDREGMSAAQAKLQTMENAAWQLIDPRVEGAQQKIVNWNSRLKGRSRRSQFYY